VSPLVESGRVYLRDQAAWLNDFLEELTSFPAAPHDDQTDAFCQALSYLRGNHIWRSSDGGYVSVQRSVWAPSRRPMSVAEQDRLDDSQADIDRMRRRSGWASRWGLRGHCW
jgi:hypothetical protein